MLLITNRPPDWANALHLPEQEDNLFHRLIRNPRAESVTPRERECTEMLCAVLRNSRSIRHHLFSWLAKLLGHQAEGMENLQFTIDTEGPIGAKRDDLRIEGWMQTKNGAEQVVLWTVEVKVGAHFHESSPLVEFPVMAGDEELVNQIVNYDHWLNQQCTPFRAGIVLAIDDLSSSLPAKLTSAWRCATWTELGLQLRDFLGLGIATDVDNFLAQHFLGFIRDHLWRDSLMSDFRLDFEDIAFARAFVALGHECANKVYRLVDSVEPLLSSSPLGQGEITSQNLLFTSVERSIRSQYLFDPGFSKEPCLNVGVEKAKLITNLTSPVTNKQKASITTAVQTVLSSLQRRNVGWHIPEQSGIDLELHRPLESLLAADNQEDELREFVAGAFDDLCAVGIVEELRRQITNVI